MNNITIINVYDNVGFDPKFKTGFGCSDCNCYSHLFRLSSLKNIQKLNLKNRFF